MDSLIFNILILVDVPQLEESHRREVPLTEEVLGGGFDLETGILESHFFEANYLLRDKRQASSIIYSFGKVRDKNLSISCLDPETCTKCVT